MKKDIYAVWLVIVLLLSIVIVANAEEPNPDLDGPFEWQLNKPLLCGKAIAIDKYYIDQGFIPVLRSSSKIAFQTVIYFKPINDGETNEIVITEINPTGTVSCVTFAGPKVQFNMNFWNEFLSTTIYLDSDGIPI